MTRAHEISCAGLRIPGKEAEARLEIGHVPEPMFQPAWS